ncbi:MAG: thioredoxin [Flavobacteriaceae bacterium]
MDDAIIGQPNGAADLIRDTTTQTFAADVIDASRQVPVIVDFWAPWCGPCKQLTPVLEKAVREARGAVRLVKMNIDEHPEVAGQLGVQSIPAVFAFKNGQPVDGFMGAQPESSIKAFIARLAGPVEDPAAEILEAGDAALAAGDIAQAAEAYSTVLQQDQTNLHALGGIVRCMTRTGELDRARQMLAVAPDDKAGNPHIAGARAELELAEQSASVGDTAELERRVAADPADHQARFDLALALNAHGRREDAAAALVEIVRRNRGWNDEAARKQLLQFFEAWGPADEATASGRRALSSVLFA